MNKEAYNYCIFLLSKRDYSRFKIQQKLKQRKLYSPEEIEDVIERLIEQKYLREEEYIKIQIKSLLLRGYANNYIKNKLAQEKIAITDEQIEKSKTDNHIYSDEQINYLIEKKLRSKDIPKDFEGKHKLKNKLTRFLLTKGYSYSSVKDSISNALKD